MGWTFEDSKADFYIDEKKKIQREGEVTDEEKEGTIKGAILEKIKDSGVQKANWGLGIWQEQVKEGSRRKWI